MDAGTNSEPEGENAKDSETTTNSANASEVVRSRYESEMSRISN